MNQSVRLSLTCAIVALCVQVVIGQQPPEFRSVNGRGNNLNHPEWGSAEIDLLRLAPSAYADGHSEPAGADRLSPRAISNIVLAQEKSIPNDRKMTDMVWQWGQFLDHDIDLSEAADPPEPFSIPVPEGDPFFDPDGTGSQSISLFRTIYNSTSHPRQQINEISAIIDGSNVYGSNEETAHSLRSFVDGRLRVTESKHGDLLPEDDTGFFIAGDIRANEQVFLTSMHTLFVREHNRIADKLAQKNEHWSDERIYQEARRIVVAELQAITFNEFLPTLLGNRAIHPYRGYQQHVNPGIFNEFSTAAFRVGHTMLNSELQRLDNDGNVIAAGNLQLRDAFFNPSHVKEQGIDPHLKGLTAQACQEIDAKIVDDVRNFLFGQPGRGGFDLGSLNIQRGRDHGLPDYNAMRVAMGLKAAESFDDISSDVDVQVALFEAYQGDVDNIDLWVGALAEDHVEGASVGELLQTILVLQFEILRDGDRFWYERTFEGRELNKIQRTTLAHIIKRNTDITNLQENVFMLRPDNGRYDNLAAAATHYNFYIDAGGVWENYLGDQSKWLRSESRNSHGSHWFYILPNGDLHEWDEASGELAGNLIAHAGRNAWENPELICGASFVTLTEEEESVVDAADADRHFYRASQGNFYFNQMGHRERWIKGQKSKKSPGCRNNPWYYILPNGEVKEWDGNNDLLGGPTVVDLGNEKLYHRPSLLFEANLYANPITDTSVDQNWGFFFARDGDSVRNLHEDFLPDDDVKWFYGADNLFFYIRTDGRVYLWDGFDDAHGAEVANLGPHAWDNIEQVVNGYKAPINAAAETLDRELSFRRDRTDQNFWFNSAFANEKWIRGNPKVSSGQDSHSHWYFIVPGGNLYAWNGRDDLVGSEYIGNFPTAYDHPGSLCDAYADGTVSNGAIPYTFYPTYDDAPGDRLTE